MYTPRHFAADEAAGLDLIERNGFGALIMPGADGKPEISHFPFVVDRAGHRLLAHAARANPIWKLMDGNAEATAVFQGPNAYVSPDWYEKPAASVPTWNYAVVHIHGRPVALDDDGLLDILVRLTAVNEAKLAPKKPWTIDKLDPAFFGGLRKGIVGFALPIERIEAKLKLSQNKIGGPDFARTRDALDALDDQDAKKTAAMMATFQPR
jgi:transcriptional regulator